MALTFRSDKASALSINELDNNFRHFTGSHEISGSITLTEGGDSSTLSATDITNLKLGKSIVDTANQKGGITNYLAVDRLINSADDNTYVDLRATGVIDTVVNSTSVFKIDDSRDIIYLGDVGGSWLTNTRGDLKVDGNLLLGTIGVTLPEGNPILYARNASASFGDTFVNGLKVGSNSVVIEGDNTSYVKATVFTSLDGNNGSNFASDIYQGASSTFGTTRIVLGAPNSDPTTPNDGIIWDRANNESISGINTSRIRFEVNDDIYADFVNSQLEAYKPIKLTGNGIPTADTSTDLQILVLKNGVITPGNTVGNLGGDPGDGQGEENQFAFATASFVGAASILADSKNGSISFAAESGLIFNVSDQTATFKTGSDFTVPLTLQDVTNNGNTTTTSVTVGQLSVSADAQIATTLTVEGATTITDNLFVNDPTDQGGIFLGVTNADGNSGASFIHDNGAHLTIENYDNNINLVAGGNIGIGTSNPDTKITLGQSGDDVKLFADVDNAAANVLMLNADNVVKKSTFADLLAATTIDASQISNLNYFTVADLPEGTVSGSIQVDFDLLTNLPAGLVSGGMELNAGSNQGDLNLLSNGVSADSVTVPGLSPSDTPSFVTLDLTNVATDTTSERTPLVLDGNRIKLGNVDYATVDQVNTILAAAGSFILSFTGSDDGSAVQTFDIYDSSSKFNINTPGEGLTLSANGSYGINLVLSDGVVSGSSQIASAISGAFGEVSGAIASDIADNTTNITTNTTNITTLTNATSSYFTLSSDVDGTGITNNSITIAGTSVSLGGAITLATITNNSNIVSGSGQIDFGSITGTDNVLNGQLDLNEGATQGIIKLDYQEQGESSVTLGSATAHNLGTSGTPTFSTLKLTGLTGDNSLKPLVIDGDGNIHTGSEYALSSDVDPYDLDITTSGDNGSITITNAETLIISGAGGLDVTSDTNTMTLTIGNGIVSGSSQININETTGDLTDLGTVTSGDITNILPDGTVSGSLQISFDGISGVPSGLVSGTIAFKNGDSDAVTLIPSKTASFIQTTQGTVFDLEVTSTGGGDGVTVTLYTPDGVISGSSQVNLTATNGYSSFSSSIASDIADNESAINTNTGNISTNATNIGNNASSISSINSVTSSFLTSIDGAVSSSTFSSPSQGTVRAIVNGVQTDVDTGLQTGDSPTFTALTLTGENPITLSPGGLTNNASTVPLVYEAGTGKIYIGDAYSTYTPDSDFTSFVASGSTGGATIGGADTLTIGGNNGITTVGTQNGQNGQITVGLDSTFDILNHFNLAADISGAFEAVSASIVTDISTLSSSIASDIFTNITNIANNITDIANATASIDYLVSEVSDNNTDINNLQASSSAGIRFVSAVDGGTLSGFNIGLTETASFDAAGGSGLAVSVTNDTVTYTLNGVISSSAQISSQISGAFGASVTDLQDQIDTNYDNIQTNSTAITNINNSTSSLENQNAFATASIVGGDSILSDGPNGQLSFEAGNGIHLSIENNAIVITSSGGGGGADGYIGDAQDHTAGGNLNMDSFDITNVNDLKVENNIVLENGGGTAGKIAFGNDLTNTFIYANTANSANEDLEIHSQVDVLLRPTNNVGIKTTTPQYELDVAGTIRAKQVAGQEGDIISERMIYAANGLSHLDDNGTGVFFGSDTVHIKGNDISLANIQTDGIVFNDDNVADMINSIRFSTTANDNTLFIGAYTANAAYNGNVGIHTNQPTHNLTIKGSLKVDETTNTEVILANLPEATTAVTEVVMVHPTTGQLYTTASEAIGGGGGTGVTIEGEVISSNTIALYDHTNSTATFPAMTDPEEGSTSPLQENYGYLRAEFYGRSGNDIQAARTVFVWESGSGDNLIATTVEDIRTDAAVTLFDINSVTGSWDSSGNLVMTLQQYNQGVGANVDYKLRYITI